MHDGELVLEEAELLRAICASLDCPLPPILGVDGDESITLEELAAEAGCMTYEVTCSVGRRVPRLYRGGEQLSVPAQAPPEMPRTTAPAPQESPL